MWRVVLVSSGILIVGCAATSKPQPEDRSTALEVVFGTVWEWEGTEAPSDACVVPTPERYTLQFLPDGKLQGRFDCNTGGGSYTMSAGKLSLGPLISTRRACPPDSLDGRYMKDLGQVTGYYVQQGTLHLVLSGDSGTMRFRPGDRQ